MREFPQNQIPKASNYSDKMGDFVESYSLDLSGNYGSWKPNRMKLVTSSTTESDVEIPVAFNFYNGEYIMVTDDFVYRGGNEVNDPFTKDTRSNAPSGNISEALSDAEIFNGALYVSGGDEVYKLSGSVWSKPITSGLTFATPHLMATLGTSSGSEARLYITENFTKVLSINTSDVLATSGSFTLDTGFGSTWSITMLEAGDSVWIGLADSGTGRGAVIEWDGATEDTPTRVIQLNSAVAAGCLVDGIPYVMDMNGRLLRYGGFSFVEVDKLPFNLPLTMTGSRGRTNLRYIHPNGMTATDRNTILINVSNETEATNIYQNNAPSGIYEYDPQIGLYHKYAYSTSPVGATTVTDYGHPRVFDIGAIYFSRSTTPTATSNGFILAGAQYFTSTTTSEYGIFTNESLNTTQGYGYFVTPKVYSTSVQDTWKEVYAVYDEILNASDKIVVKYRTREKNSTDATGYWIDSLTFTTTDDVSDFEAGDEVTIVEGVGAGQAMEIDSIEASSSTYTVKVKANPLSATGTSTALFENWKKFGEVSNETNKQYTQFTLRENNVSPWVQLKVEMYLTDNELHKIRLEHSKHINT